MNRKKVLVFRALPVDQLARLQAVHHVAVANPKIACEQAAFFSALPDVQGLIGASYPIDDKVLAQAPRLEVVSSISVGVDNYDLDALDKRGILLTHTPGVLTETTADTANMTFPLVCVVPRKLAILGIMVWFSLDKIIAVTAKSL